MSRPGDYAALIDELPDDVGQARAHHPRPGSILFSAADVWGVQPSPDERLDAGQLAFFDHLAALTSEPGSSFEELRRTYGRNDELRVPEIVHNSLLDRSEPVPAAGC